jgi:anti-sigma regulatory factor (Ser/Thr protein kinase)
MENEASAQALARTDGGADVTRAAAPRRLMRWVVIVGFWTFFGALNGSQLYLGIRSEGGATNAGLGRVFAWQMLGWLPWAFLTPAVLWLGRRFPLERPGLALALTVHAAACALIYVIHSAVFTVANILLSPFETRPRPFMEMFSGRLMSQFHIDLLIYGAVLGTSYAVGYYARFREREVRATQLEARLAQAELQALKMQLHPHFLFNTLNGIAGLVRDRKNSAAVEMIAGLSDLLRYTLDGAGRQEVTLREELEFLELYLGIQQKRFPDRLRVEMSVEPGALEALVPNLILQPLVENAIRHGVSRRAAAGTVGVAAAREGGRLRIRVYDDGPGLRRDLNGNANTHEAHEGSSSGGIGLSNTRARLRQLYGDAQSFEVSDRAAGGVEASLSLPFRRGAAPPKGDALNEPGDVSEEDAE